MPLAASYAASTSRCPFSAREAIDRRLRARIDVADPRTGTARPPGLHDVRARHRRADGAHGPGVDLDDAMLPADPEFSSTPGITIVRSGDWLVALEDSVWARGRRLDVLSGLSAGT